MQLANGVCGSSPTPPYICPTCVGFSPSYFSPQPHLLQVSHLNTNSFRNTTSPASSSASSSSGQPSFLQASHLNTNSLGNTTSPAFSFAPSSSPPLPFLQASHLNTNLFHNTTSQAFSSPSNSSTYQDTIHPYQGKLPLFLSSLLCILRALIVRS
jgi:hypothetical protein